MKQIASEFKEILMMRMMRSLPPKPPFQEKEKEEKGTAEMHTSSKADAVFVSSIHIAREEEVRHSGEILKFLNHFYSLNMSLLVSLFRAKNEKTRTRTFRFTRLYFAYAHFSLSLV